MWQYRCETCGALYESKKKADWAVCRSSGCTGRAVRVQGRYTHK